MLVWLVTRNVAVIAMYLSAPIKPYQAQPLWTGDVPSWALIYKSIHQPDVAVTRMLPIVNSSFLNQLMRTKTSSAMVVQFATNMLATSVNAVDTLLVSGLHTAQLARVAYFTNVWLNSEGWIVLSTTHQAARNGGCATNTNWQRPTLVKKYSKVISITAMWGSATWHFPMEAFVGLFAVQSVPAFSDWVTNPDVFVHVSKPNSWTLKWLSLLHIPHERIISGEIMAQTALVPEMGRCGTPSLTQILLMRRLLQNTTTVSAYNKHAADVIIIRRHGEREIRNHKKLETAVKNWAARYALSVAIHDPGAKDSLQKQIHTFSHAKYIIGPHGAGLLFQLTAPPGAVVMEFMPSPGANACFLRLAYLLGHRYVMEKLNNGMVDVWSAIAQLNRFYA